MKNTVFKIRNLACFCMIITGININLAFSMGSMGGIAQEKTQWAVLALEEAKALLEEAMLEKDEINHASLSYEALGLSDKANDEKYNIREDIINLKEQKSIPRWEKLNETLVIVEEKVGSDAYPFDAVREEIRLAKEKDENTAQMLRDLNSDAILFNTMNFKKIRDNADAGDESFDAQYAALEESCHDGEHGRNCQEQLTAKLDAQTLKILQDDNAATDATNLALSAHITQARKRYFAAVAHAKDIGGSDYYKAAEESEPLTLDPKIWPK